MMTKHQLLGIVSILVFFSACKRSEVVPAAPDYANPAMWITEDMAPGNRFWTPYYRHATIEAFTSRDEAVIHARTRLAMQDICDAFDYFLTQHDPQRPLVIAGFSQGGLAVVELLKHMDDATFSQLAGAYVLGYKVTEEDLASCPHIKPAEGADDTGVTICYNTVKDVKYVNPVISATRTWATSMAASPGSTANACSRI